MPRLPTIAPLLRAAIQPLAPRLPIRSFSQLPTLRPTLHSQTNIFRSPNPTLFPLSPTSACVETTGVGGAVADLVPQSSISAHPAFGALQIRCGPRPTMSGATRLIQKRRHGFLSRVKTKNGQKTLQRRKTKGRKRLSY